MPDLFPDPPDAWKMTSSRKKRDPGLGVPLQAHGTGLNNGTFSCQEGQLRVSFGIPVVIGDDELDWHKACRISKDAFCTGKARRGLIPG